MQRQHFTARHAAVVLDAGKFADGQLPVVIHHRAFGPHAAKRRTPAAQIAQVGLGFLVHFHGARCRHQLRELQQGRCAAAVAFDAAQKVSAFGIPQAQRAHAADIIHAQQIVHFAQLGDGHLVARSLRRFTALRVIARNDSAAPAIRLGIGEGEVKDGIVFGRCFAKLVSRHQGQIR